MSIKERKYKMIIVCSKKHMKKIQEELKSLPQPRLDVKSLTAPPGERIYKDFGFPLIEFRVNKYLKKVRIIDDTQFKFNLERQLKT